MKEMKDYIHEKKVLFNTLNKTLHEVGDKSWKYEGSKFDYNFLSLTQK